MSVLPIAMKQVEVQELSCELRLAQLFISPRTDFSLTYFLDYSLFTMFFRLALKQEEPWDFRCLS